MPTVRSHPLRDADPPLLSNHWIEAPPVQVVLDALQQLRRDLGHKVVIVGKVMGPWTLSYHMMGVESFLICTKTAPERARRMLETLKEVTIAFAVAQMQSGADIICIADHITGGMVSPLVYRDVVLPIHKEIITRLGCPTVLHCCGNTTDRVRYFAQAGFDCYHLESQVDLASATRDAAGHMTLMGNINNPEILLQGNPEDISQACHQALDQGILLLAPECAVPLATPIRSLQVLVEVAEARRIS
jgi:[methyl-Co(III) methanol-specific corrinoid protein]:coenzyme M methyltransferase